MMIEDNSGVNGLPVIKLWKSKNFLHKSNG